MGERSTLETISSLTPEAWHPSTGGPSYSLCTLEAVFPGVLRPETRVLVYCLPFFFWWRGGEHDVCQDRIMDLSEVHICAHLRVWCEGFTGARFRAPWPSNCCLWTRPWSVPCNLVLAGESGPVRVESWGIEMELKRSLGT